MKPVSRFASGVSPPVGSEPQDAKHWQQQKQRAWFRNTALFRHKISVRYHQAQRGDLHVRDLVGEGIVGEEGAGVAKLRPETPNVRFEEGVDVEQPGRPEGRWVGSVEEVELDIGALDAVDIDV